MGITPHIERARAKHNELVAQLAKLNDKREKALATLIRIDAKRTSAIRAIARSTKRMDRAAQSPAIPLAKLGETDAGKANKASWNAIPAVKRSRRTPDDFKAEMTVRKTKSPPKAIDGLA